jgi:hypothetical protein
MTGVEAVSNGVNAFREPTQKNAKRTLTIIIVLLMVFLAGIALLCRAYSIGATDPGAAGYQSILSQLTAAVMGRGWFYYVTIGPSSRCSRSRPTPRTPTSPASPAPSPCTTTCRTSSRSAAAACSTPTASTPWSASPRSADRLRRRHRPPDPALCHRRLSCLHALPGRHGDALEAQGGPGALHRMIINGVGAVATGITLSSCWSPSSPKAHGSPRSSFPP